MSSISSGGAGGAAGAPNDQTKLILAALVSAMRAAQKASELKAGQTTELSMGFAAAAEALHSIEQGSGSGGTQCLWYPGPGNGKRLFNYETQEWEGSC